jgi:hypothetical protein
MKIVARLEPCLIGIEACGVANYWARRFAEFGGMLSWRPKRVFHFLCPLNGLSMKNIGPQTAES